MIKVIWALLEMGLNFERIDAGLDFGMVETSTLRSKNPNGLVAVLEDGLFIIWESNSTLRYTARSALDNGGLYPGDLKESVAIDQWDGLTAIAMRRLSRRPVFIQAIAADALAHPPWRITDSS